MFTNDIKKGQHIRLRNGLHAIMHDNRRGNARLVHIQSPNPEFGSVYGHDILYVMVDNNWVRVQHTQVQRDTKHHLAAMKVQHG